MGDLAVLFFAKDEKVKCTLWPTISILPAGLMLACITSVEVRHLDDW